jgi:IS5 family transposase
MTRKRIFLEEMNAVVPWASLVGIRRGYAPVAKSSRPPFPIETMLRIHFLQLWNNYSDPSIAEALHDMAVYRWFAGLVSGASRLPDETTILRFRHFLEEFGLTKTILTTVNDLLQAKGLLLKSGSAVDATLIAAPSSTKNDSGTRDPEMHQTKKGNQYHFGMKAHIGVDAEFGLFRTLVTTAANVHDFIQAQDLLHGEETDVFADSGYRGVEKREEAKGLQVGWYIAMMPGKRRALNLETASGQLRNAADRVKAGIRAKIEHPFRVIKCQFGFTKVRYRGRAKNIARLKTLFALSNL